MFRQKRRAGSEKQKTVFKHPVPDYLLGMGAFNFTSPKSIKVKRCRIEKQREVRGQGLQRE